MLRGTVRLTRGGQLSAGGKRARLRWLSAAMLDWAVRWAAGEERLGRALKERGSGREKEKWAAGLGCWVGFLGFGFGFLFLFLSSFLFQTPLKSI